MVASRTHTDVLWVHNDSGGEPAVYGVTMAGEVVARALLVGIVARDWEDIALGPGPVPDVPYLYTADIGDNTAILEEVVVHRFPEPALGESEVSVVETLQIRYPDGPMDAETLMVDSDSGEIIIVGKAISGVTPVYAVPPQTTWDEPVEAIALGTISLGSFAIATGGDADRDRIVLRTYDELFLWERQADEGLADALAGQACRVARVLEQQGEAVALLPGNSIVTTSEGEPAPVSIFSLARP